jgi:hypothetical protein
MPYFALRFDIGTIVICGLFVPEKGFFKVVTRIIGFGLDDKI